MLLQQQIGAILWRQINIELRLLQKGRPMQHHATRAYLSCGQPFDRFSKLSLDPEWLFSFPTPEALEKGKSNRLYLKKPRPERGRQDLDPPAFKAISPLKRLLGLVDRHPTFVLPIFWLILPRLSFSTTAVVISPF